MQPIFSWRLVVAVLILAGAVFMTVTRDANLGLDLEGGTQIVLEAQPGPDLPVDDANMDRTVESLRRRVDALGVAEPNLQRSGANRIIVELPGVTDPEQAQEVIGRTAQLEFYPVIAAEALPGESTTTAPPTTSEDEPTTTTRAEESTTTQAPETTAAPSSSAPPTTNEAGEKVIPDEGGAGIRVGAPALTGDLVGNAQAVVDPTTSQWTVNINFRGDGGNRWATLTGQAACNPVGDPKRRVAIALDGRTITSPQVNDDIQCNVGIAGGSTIITGDFSEAEARDLALLIRSGALPLPVTTLSQSTIGATLGDAAIQASINAAVIGAALTILYMLLYYRLLGGITAVSLIAYGVISFAVLLVLGSTLTLPGIAGFVLAIGMAIDANVLVYERAKEEYAAGTRLRASFDRGFAKALSAIVDANVSTLIAAALLFFLATGAVRGFAVTVVVGVVTSLFTTLVITRLLVTLALRSNAVVKRPAVLGMRVGGRLREWIAERQPNLFARSKLWFALSGLVILLSVGGLVARGLNFGIEFTGGRLLEYSTEREVSADQAREALTGAGFPRAVVQVTEGGNLAVRTAELSDADEDQIEQAIAGTGGTTEKVRDELVGPAIGDELRRNALTALGIGLALQLAYIAIRFRWTYGVSAIAGMLQSVLILLGVFAWTGRQVDGVFVAALLTVIGYSLNDAVVVFDRIRERVKTRLREPLAALANEAVLQTIPRTINTGLGALFILTALLFLGGDTLTDFALALLVGIVAGTLSSVFTSSQLAVVIERRAGADARVRPSPGARQRAAREQRATVSGSRGAGSGRVLTVDDPDADAEELPDGERPDGDGDGDEALLGPARRSGGGGTGRPRRSGATSRPKGGKGSSRSQQRRRKR